MLKSAISLKRRPRKPKSADVGWLEVRRALVSTLRWLLRPITRLLLTFFNPIRWYARWRSAGRIVDSDGHVIYSPSLWQRAVTSLRSDEYRRRELLAWLGARLPPHVALDTRGGPAWSSGVPLCALLEALYPGACPGYPLLKPHHRHANCNLALRLATKYLAIPKLTTLLDYLWTNAHVKINGFYCTEVVHWNTIRAEELANSSDDVTTGSATFHLLTLIRALSTSAAQRQKSGPGGAGPSIRRLLQSAGADGLHRILGQTQRKHSSSSAAGSSTTVDSTKSFGGVCYVRAGWVSHHGNKSSVCLIKREADVIKVDGGDEGHTFDSRPIEQEPYVFEFSEIGQPPSSVEQSCFSVGRDDDDNGDTLMSISDGSGDVDKLCECLREGDAVGDEIQNGFSLKACNFSNSTTLETSGDDAAQKPFPHSSETPDGGDRSKTEHKEKESDADHVHSHKGAGAGGNAKPSGEEIISVCHFELVIVDDMNADNLEIEITSFAKTSNDDHTAGKVPQSESRLKRTPVDFESASDLKQQKSASEGETCAPEYETKLHRYEKGRNLSSPSRIPSLEAEFGMISHWNKISDEINTRRRSLPKMNSNDEVEVSMVSGWSSDSGSASTSRRNLTSARSSFSSITSLELEQSDRLSRIRVVDKEPGAESKILAKNIASSDYASFISDHIEVSHNDSRSHIHKASIKTFHLKAVAVPEHVSSREVSVNTNSDSREKFSYSESFETMSNDELKELSSSLLSDIQNEAIPFKTAPFMSDISNKLSDLSVNESFVTRSKRYVSVEKGLDVDTLPDGSLRFNFLSPHPVIHIHQISVRWDGHHVAGSPFELDTSRLGPQIDPKTINLSKSFVKSKNALMQGAENERLNSMNDPNGLASGTGRLESFYSLTRPIGDQTQPSDPLADHFAKIRASGVKTGRKRVSFADAISVVIDKVVRPQLQQLQSAKETPMLANYRRSLGSEGDSTQGGNYAGWMRGEGGDVNEGTVASVLQRSSRIHRSLGVRGRFVDVINAKLATVKRRRVLKQVFSRGGQEIRQLTQDEIHQDEEDSTGADVSSRVEAKTVHDVISEETVLGDNTKEETPATSDVAKEETPAINYVIREETAVSDVTKQETAANEYGEIHLPLNDVNNKAESDVTSLQRENFRCAEENKNKAVDEMKFQARSDDSIGLRKQCDLSPARNRNKCGKCENNDDYTHKECGVISEKNLNGMDDRLLNMSAECKDDGLSASALNQLESFNLKSSTKEHVNQLGFIKSQLQTDTENQSNIVDISMKTSSNQSRTEVFQSAYPPNQSKNLKQQSVGLHSQSGNTFDNIDFRLFSDSAHSDSASRHQLVEHVIGHNTDEKTNTEEGHKSNDSISLTTAIEYCKVGCDQWTQVHYDEIKLETRWKRPLLQVSPVEIPSGKIEVNLPIDETSGPLRGLGVGRIETQSAVWGSPILVESNAESHLLKSREFASLDEVLSKHLCSTSSTYPNKTTLTKHLEPRLNSTVEEISTFDCGLINGMQMNAEPTMTSLKNAAENKVTFGTALHSSKQENSTFDASHLQANVNNTSSVHETTRSHRFLPEIPVSGPERDVLQIPRPIKSGSKPPAGCFVCHDDVGVSTETSDQQRDRLMRILTNLLCDASSANIDVPVTSVNKESENSARRLKYSKNFERFKNIQSMHEYSTVADATTIEPQKNPENYAHRRKMNWYRTRKHIALGSDREKQKEVEERESETVQGVHTIMGIERNESHNILEQNGVTDSHEVDGVQENFDFLMDYQGSSESGENFTAAELAPMSQGELQEFMNYLDSMIVSPKPAKGGVKHGSDTNGPTKGNKVSSTVGRDVTDRVRISMGYQRKVFEAV